MHSVEKSRFEMGIQAELKLAERAMKNYNLPSNATVKLLNYSENTTFLVEEEEGDYRSVLRVHRPSYHSKAEIAAELEWLQTIAKQTEIKVPVPIAGKNGDLVQAIEVDEDPYIRYCVLFPFLEGHSPDEENLIIQFERLGFLTASLHKHVEGWTDSSKLNRPTWHFETMLGQEPRWGRWQDGMDMTPEFFQLFQKTADVIKYRLDKYGNEKGRFGLIHADLRLANLLIANDEIKIIDFDDCGYSWYLYDLGSALSFIEHKDYVPDLIQSWLKGYRQVRMLTKEDEAEIPTFIMLRRLLLLAWLGSHSDSDNVKELGEKFTERTAELAQKYIMQFSKNN